MSRFNVLPAVRQERLNICRKCKWYDDKTIILGKTGWCGTPVIGKTVEPEENNVTYYREKIKLCGCHMPTKTWFRFLSCPANKWHALDWSEKEIRELDSFITRIHGAPKIEDMDRAELARWHSKMTGRREQVSACVTCIKDLITDFRRQLGKLKEDENTTR